MNGVPLYILFLRRTGSKGPSLQDFTGLFNVRIKQSLRRLSDADKEVYHFLNVFRFASQLNINPVNFDSAWGERIHTVYLDWKNDPL